MEVICGIFCLFGSSSWDFVHYRKILVGFCAYLEVPSVILELPEINKIPRGTYKIAQNPMRNFQRCTKSHKKLPNMHKIPRGSSENAQNPMIDFE
jgi:hypothetical protein